MSQKLKFVLILVLASIFFTVLVCFAIFKKRTLLVILVILLVGVIPATMIYFKSGKLENNKKLILETNTFTGKIYKVSEKLERNRLDLYLNDVYIENGENKEEFFGNVYVILYADGVDTSKIEIGRYVKITNAQISCFTLNKGASDRDRSFVSRNNSASAFVFSYNVHFENKIERSFRDKIKNKVYESFKNTDTFFTDIGYAMIFGESSILEDDVYNVFKDAGVAHLLAVSGFHISVIVAFLSFVLDKLKVKKYIKIVIVGLILFVYMYLCSFSISVIRASIMALLLLYASNRNKEYDKLSALSIAAIMIFFINPLQLFNLSFIFSFVSILSIILLMPIFERCFSKVFYNKLSSSLSLSLAVSFGVLVFQLAYFGYYPVLSFFSNLLTIPVMGGLFIYLIISVLIGPIFHITEFLISGFGVCMKYVVRFNSLVANIGLNLTSGNVTSVVLGLWIVFMFIVSDYVFMNKKVRICLAGVLGSLLVALMIWCKWTRQKQCGLI